MNEQEKKAVDLKKEMQKEANNVQVHRVYKYKYDPHCTSKCLTTSHSLSL